MQDGPRVELTPGKFSFKRLPDEMLLKILGFASFTDLCRLEAVSQQFRGLSQEKLFWKNLLLCYFPYAFESNAHLTQDNLKQVFKQQFEYYQSFTKTEQYGSIKINLILSALKGDLKAIEQAKINSIAKTFLTILAATHGSDEAWDKLDEVGKINVITHAARIGYLSRFQILIKKMAKISKEDYAWFLEKATENNQPHVVNFLLENYHFSALQIEKAIDFAKGADDNMIETLETKIYLLNLGMRDQREILPNYVTIVGKVLNAQLYSEPEQGSPASSNLTPNGN
jgi:hypothetical protein